MVLLYHCVLHHGLIGEWTLLTRQQQLTAPAPTHPCGSKTMMFHNQREELGKYKIQKEMVFNFSERDGLHMLARSALLQARASGSYQGLPTPHFGLPPP